MRRKDTRHHHLNRRIPADVKPQAAGLKLAIPIGTDTVPLMVSASAIAIRVSLRTADKNEARLREAQAVAYLEGVWQALRKGHGVPIAHREATALAKQLYEAWASHHHRATTTAVELDPETGAWVTSPDTLEDEPDAWEAAARAIVSRLEEETTTEEQIVGPIVDRLLLAKGIASVDASSRPVVLRAFVQALTDALEYRQRQASGDFTPDPKAQRFPEWEQPVSRLTFEELLDLWWQEAKALGTTEATYRAKLAAIATLRDYLGGKNTPASVTEDEAVAYRSALITTGKSHATLRAYLSHLRSLYGWAVSGRHLTSNPFASVKAQRAPRKALLRGKGFTEEEVAMSLSQSLAVEVAPGGKKDLLAKHWVPWLCAYTGARVGELVQLRKEDVATMDDGTVTLKITPEAGTVKDKEFRTVVLHEHVVAMGFLEVVEGSRGSYLFLPTGADRERRQAVIKLIRFARRVITDKGVRPNHGWRHLFKTRGRDVGISDSILDAICGHVPANVGAGYGEVSVMAQKAAIAKFPRFSI